ncbi:HEAT repeat domain-containing protein [Nitrospira sp. Kam-Ns4a]
MTEEEKKSDDFFEPEGEAVTDELADRVADALAMPSGPAETQATGPEEPEPAEAEAVGEEEVKDEIQIQIDLLKDPDWAIRREAVITLGEMGDERCVEPLVRALRDGDWQVREVAVEALGQVGSPAVDLLIKQLRDWDVRKFAIRALGKIKDERVLEPLVQQLRSDEFGEDATDALVELGEPAVERLIAALADKDERIRRQAIIALGRIGDRRAVEPLIEKTKDKDWFTRLTAAAALEKIGDERGREAIKPLMQDPDLVVKMRAERILAAWKKKTASV